MNINKTILLFALVILAIFKQFNGMELISEEILNDPKFEKDLLDMEISDLEEKINTKRIELFSQISKRNATSPRDLCPFCVEIGDAKNEYTKDNIDEHIFWTHLFVGGFACPHSQCKTFLKRPTYLAKHHDQVHQDQCNGCSSINMAHYQLFTLKTKIKDDLKERKYHTFNNFNELLKSIPLWQETNPNNQTCIQCKKCNIKISREKREALENHALHHLMKAIKCLHCSYTGHDIAAHHRRFHGKISRCSQCIKLKKKQKTAEEDFKKNNYAEIEKFWQMQGINSEATTKKRTYEVYNSGAQ